MMMMIVRIKTRVMTIKMMTALHASALRGLELVLEIIMQSANMMICILKIESV